jgi:hypothetical protein
LEGLLLGKFIDEQGKLFGLINLLDLAVIAVLVMVGLRVLADYKPVSPDYRTSQVMVDFVISDIPPYLADSLVIGQDVYEDKTGAYLGKVTSLQIAPAELLLEGNHTLILVKSPRNLDLRMRLQNRGRKLSGPAHAGIYLGKLAVRVGDHLKAHTMYTSLRGEIESLKVTGSGGH